MPIYATNKCETSEIKEEESEWTIIEHFLDATYSVITLYTKNLIRRRWIFLSHFHRWENWGSDQLNDLPKVI